MHYAINRTLRPEAAAVLYTIDTKVSTFTVRAFASGLLSALGHNPTIAIPEFGGQVRFDPEKIEESSLRITVKAASLAVRDEISDSDRREIERRMQEEVLASEDFPEIVYEAAKVSAASKTGDGQYWIALNGELSLRDVTRPQAVSLQLSFRSDVLRAVGDFALKQSDYDIRPISAVGGTIKLKDEIKFAFDITARKQS